MKTAIYIIIALALVSVVSATMSADNPFNKGWNRQVAPLAYERVIKACDYTLPATEFRQPIPYEGAGVLNWRGECIIPSKTRQAPVVIPVKTEPKPSCYDKEVCKDERVCGWVCDKYWHGFCIDWDWECHKKEVCHTIEVCDG